MTETDTAPDSRRDRLLAELRAGEESAYAEVFHEHFASLRDYACRYVKSWDTAADIVQQVFVNLYETRERLTFQRGVRAYLFGAVHHRALNHLRDARVQQVWLDRVARTADIDADSARVPADAAALYDERWEQARQLIDELPPRCKDAFLLVRLEELSYDEAAAALGVARSTIQTHVVRAAKILGRLAIERGLVDTPAENAPVAKMSKREPDATA